jgi:hypothetical protein
VPNVYVSVALYRAPTETDPLPRYQLGYVKLPVSTASRVLNVEISDVPQPAQPGETVTYEIQVTDDLGNGQQAELSVAVVDEAVLSLADEVGPDGLGAFWFERGLGVFTASSLAVSVDRTNEVVSEPESGGKGGGSDSDSLRSNFQNTALWEGQVETDAEGRATIELPLPDNLTTWRIAVRAISGDTQVGDGIAELLVTRPLLARPALPRFLRVGDEFAVRTLVRNATDEVQEVTVALDSAGIAVADGSPQTARVAPGESGVFAWPATVSAPGEARVRFTATAGELEDAVELTLPVLLDVTPETTATGGVVDNDPAVEALYLPDYALTENGGLEVNVQASLVNVLTSELRFFPIPTVCGRPCESTDSISSRIVATVAALGTDERDPTATTSADVAELQRRHRSDGGWGWCAVRCESDPEITAWAVIALDTARDAGVTVDINSFGRAGSYLGIEVSRARDVAEVSRASWEAFLRYAIVRSQSEPRLSPVRAIFEQNRDQLTNWGRGYLLLALMEDGDDPLNQTAIRALANDLAADAISSANGSHWEDAGTGVYLGSDLRTTSIVLRALVAVEPEHPLIEETARWLVIARTAEGWETGFQRAHAINALAAFAESTGELLGDYAFTVTLDETEVLTGEFRPRGGENAASAEVPLEEVPLGVVSLLRFEREARAPGRLYYALNLRYQTPAREVESLNRGMAISREYSLLDDPGTSIDSAPLGEVVRITLTVLTDADRKFVVVEDALPAGLEPIDPQLKIIPLDLRQQLEEEQQEAVLGPAPDYAAPWFAWYYNPWDDVQIRDERLVLFADRLPAGVHEYVFYARATTPGDYFVAPTVVEESFFPEVFGRSDSQRFGVGE